MKQLKKCTGQCKLEKSLDCFNIRSDNKKPTGMCKDCKKKYNKEYGNKNKEKISKQKKEYNRNNKEKITDKRKIYYNKNKLQILSQVKKYIKNNKEKVNNQKNRYEKNRMAIDPCFKIRKLISKAINSSLRYNGTSKNRLSSWKNLPYTKEELKQYLESLFEPWMNWQNHGSYRADTWDDNNSTTWKWQIDHLEPKSDFYFENMKCEEFSRCWALSNLRPYSAKQNWLDGATKIRHRK